MEPYANSAEPVQMSQNVASDQGLLFAYRNYYAKYHKREKPETPKQETDFLLLLLHCCFTSMVNI